jgi:phosphoribosylanthranilate isomerase
LKVKVCGITNFEDAVLCAKLGADYLGFIFYPDSPRYLPASQAAKIILQVKAYCRKNNIPTPQFVAVYVYGETVKFQALTPFDTFDILQIHNLHSIEEFNRLKQALPGHKIILARNLSTGLELQRDKALMAAADLILFDTAVTQGG